MQTKCPAGSYTNAVGQSSCTTCPAGKYCPLGTSDVSGTNQDCLAGYYCPSGTKSADQYPCPKGKFAGTTGSTVSTDCQSCTAGYACENPGTSDPTTTPCQAGYYCLVGSFFDIPQSVTYGGMCSPGEYCPAGSAAAVPCDGGKYCETYKLSAVTGTCDAGYYCTALGSKNKIIPADFTSTRGAICGIGKFCPAGATGETNCPAGTYSASTGLAASTDCYSCPAGYFCDVAGMTSGIVNICPAGYFCPFGSTSGTTNICPVGYYCPAGSPEAIICDGGTYQDTTGQSTCKTCTAGNYCPFTDGTGLAAQTTCPTGYACPDAQMTAPAACLPGEYQDETGKLVCKVCPAGSYCDRQGLSAVSGSCPAGFYCPANQVNPHEFMCSIGTYCVAGSSAETPCPVGKY
jgi:hypothetical protein